MYADRFDALLREPQDYHRKHLQKQESGAVLLTDDGRRAFLGAWQAKSRSKSRTRFLKEKIPWGLVPYVQALLLSPHSARRSGSVSAVFLEVRSKCWS